MGVVRLRWCPCVLYVYTPPYIWTPAYVQMSPNVWGYQNIRGHPNIQGTYKHKGHMDTPMFDTPPMTTSKVGNHLMI